MQCSASPPTAPRTRRLPFDELPGAHPAKGVDEVSAPARFSACPCIFSAPCGYDSTNSCSSRCIGTQNRYSSCYLLFLLSISTHRHHVGSPPVGRSPSRSTASAGGDAPQLVAGPVKDRHRSGAARAGGPHRMPARRPGSPYRQKICSVREETITPTCRLSCTHDTGMDSPPAQWRPLNGLSATCRARSYSVANCPSSNSGQVAKPVRTHSSEPQAPDFKVGLYAFR